MKSTQNIEKNKEIKKDNTMQLDMDIVDVDQKNILLVEDNTINQEIIKGLLEKSRFIIDIANNGKEALDIFEKGKYDLILMDLKMPIMDGIEATKRIRQIDEDIPIIALSANTVDQQVQKEQNAKMNDHITKPVVPEVLYHILIKYLHN